MLKRIDTIQDGEGVRVPFVMMDEVQMAVASDKNSAYEVMCDRLEGAWQKPVTGTGSGTLPPVSGGEAKDRAYAERSARLEDAWRR